MLRRQRSGSKTIPHPDEPAGGRPARPRVLAPKNEPAAAGGNREISDSLRSPRCRRHHPETCGVSPKRHIQGGPILSVNAVLAAAISGRQQGLRNRRISDCALVMSGLRPRHNGPAFRSPRPSWTCPCWLGRPSVGRPGPVRRLARTCGSQKLSKTEPTPGRRETALLAASGRRSGSC
jgi:hypothetical protein